MNFQIGIMFFILIVVGYFGVVNGVPHERLSQYFSSRIIGGVDAPEAYAPHMVALVGGTFFITVACGGSIVSTKVVLTAAHCITFFKDGEHLARNFHGRVGSNQWRSGGTVVQFSNYNIHPKYDAKYIKYDVGVLFLKKGLSLNEKIAVLGLDFKHVGAGHENFVTGWGTTAPRFGDNVVHLAPTPDDLQLIYVNTITHEECEDGIRSKAEERGDWVPHIDRHVEICTFHSRGHGMCNGDSGSALVSMRHGRQIGIVSWGLPCARGAPDVFVRISGVKDYLDTVLTL